MLDFALELRRQRGAAGHPSARAFHLSAGGPRQFGCTYKAYLNVEAGRSVPQPGLAMRIAALLGVPLEPARARAYVSAYLRSLVGRRELAEFLLRSLDGSQGPARSLFHRASEMGFHQKTVPLTRAQADALCSDTDRYWCWSILSDDGGRWAPEALARLLGSTPRRIRAALAALLGEGLLDREPDGRWFCRDAGKVFKYPRGGFYMPDYRAALKKHWGAMIERRGGRLLRRYGVLRASEAELRRSFPYLAQAVNGAHIYSVTEPAADTGLFVVEAAVRRLASF